MDEGTKLVDLCAGSYEGLKAPFTLSSGESMLVEHLNGYTRDELVDFVKAKGGPWELVAGWVQKHQLWRFLRDYESPNSKRPHMSVREGRDVLLLALCQCFFIAFFFHAHVPSGGRGWSVRCLCRLQCLSCWLVD